MREEYLDFSDETLWNLLLQLKKENPNAYQECIQNTRMKMKILHMTDLDVFLKIVCEKNILRDILSDQGFSLLPRTISKETIQKLGMMLEHAEGDLSWYMHNDYFLAFFYQHRNFYVGKYISYLDIDCLFSFMNYCTKNKKDEKVTLEFLRWANKEVITELFEKGKLPRNQVLYLIHHGTGEVISKLLELDLSITTLSHFKYHELQHILKVGAVIPVRLLEEKTFLQKMITMESVKSYRLFIELLRKNHDVSTFETLRKKYYERQLGSYLEEEGMLEDYFRFYQKMQEFSSHPDRVSICRKYLKDYFPFFGDPKNFSYFSKNCCDALLFSNWEKFHHFLEKESQLAMTNMIIDYHLEDIPYNVCLDINQLIHYVEESPSSLLSKEDLKLYQKFLTLDHCSYLEKMDFHESLKHYCMREKYYDDFKRAKEDCYQQLKKKLLTSHNIHPYYDEEASKKYGVSIYRLTGDPFSVLVKGLCIPKTDALTKDSFQCYVDGGSYSIDGDQKLVVFDNPYAFYVAAFDNFPTDQVAHVYPIDSYSDYIREKKPDASEYVNQLMLPEELITASSNYNELVIAQPNQNRNDDVNSRLILPKMFALYCFDEICENDIVSAKNLGLSIIVVDTLSYLEKMDITQKEWDTKNLLAMSKEELLEQGLIYIRHAEEKDMESRRKNQYQKKKMIV